MAKEIRDIVIIKNTQKDVQGVDQTIVSVNYILCDGELSAQKSKVLSLSEQEHDDTVAELAAAKADLESDEGIA